jgi:hypothetical protein
MFSAPPEAIQHHVVGEIKKNITAGMIRNERPQSTDGKNLIQSGKECKGFFLQVEPSIPRCFP